MKYINCERICEYDGCYEYTYHAKDGIYCGRGHKQRNEKDRMSYNEEI